MVWRSQGCLYHSMRSERPSPIQYSVVGPSVWYVTLYVGINIPTKNLIHTPPHNLVIPMISNTSRLLAYIALLEVVRKNVVFWARRANTFCHKCWECVTEFVVATKDRRNWPRTWVRPILLTWIYPLSKRGDTDLESLSLVVGDSHPMNGNPRICSSKALVQRTQKKADCLTLDVNEEGWLACFPGLISYK